MPYHIQKSGSRWKVTSKSGKTLGTHESKDKAIKQMVAVSKKEGLF